jgi:hypothetical protein
MENPLRMTVIDADPQPQQGKALGKGYIITGVVILGVILVWLGILTVLFLK